MKKVQFNIDNLKCGGCVKTVTKAVESVPEVKEVIVDLNSASVEFTTTSDSPEDIRSKVLEKLAAEGYPLQGTSSNWQKAKSYVGCAVGKMS